MAAICESSTGTIVLSSNVQITSGSDDPCPGQSQIVSRHMPGKCRRRYYMDDPLNSGELIRT